MSGQLKDKYGNLITKEGELIGERLIYCCFPDCGCDGARLCMAENGASENAVRCNVEGMYHRKDKRAQQAKHELLKLVAKAGKHGQR